MDFTRGAGVLLLLAGVSLLPLAFAEERAAPHHRRPTETRFAPRGGLATTAAAEIDSAVHTIDIGMYSISIGPNAPIFQALARAGARGVAMRMIFNKAHSGTRNKQKSLKLEAAGVDVRYVTRTMHEKFAIIDGSLLLTGSANWSISADQRASENMQVIASPQHLVHDFKREFRLLLSRSRDFDPEEFAP